VIGHEAIALSTASTVGACYFVRGGAAEAVPGTGANEVLRGKDGRTYVGGGPRVGK